MKKELETMKTKLMTKLALAAAVVALGLAAQAEMLYWKATVTKTPSGDTVTEANRYLAYIFADTGSGTTKSSTPNMFSESGGKNPITTYSTVLDRLANSQDIYDLAYYNSKGVRSYESTKGRLSTYSNGTASYDYQVGWIGDGGVVKLFAVILDGTTFEDSKNYMIAQTTDGTQVLTKTTSSNAEPGTTVYFDWGSQDNNSWTRIGSASSPEPTSGLLLLVGLSALALRRKKAVS